MKPSFNLDKIKFATDPGTYQRAVEIYESDGVQNFEDTGFSYVANIKGSKGNLYKVVITHHHYDQGSCNCYLGQNDVLCKHMVAVAIYAILRGKKLKKEEKKIIEGPKSSGRLGKLKKEELAEIKKDITKAIKHIKPYNGPSRIWFAYQDSLNEGCLRLSKIISEIPICKESADLLVDLLLRLDRKIGNGVDDSDGVVSGFMEEVIEVLLDYVKYDSKCIESFEKVLDKETLFDWETPLIDVFKKKNIDID